MPGKNVDFSKDFFIVGIGASAGGVQALQEFFRHVPARSGLAYVVILHLSPNHDSQLAQVLQHETQMPVVQVTEKTLIEADRVYVVPPDHHLSMEHQYIAVLPNMLIEDRRAPVDIFFRSLANHYGPRAISVVLSGTGANGSMGLKRIKELGGASFVQNPREAEFNEMPRNAIATDLIDEVLNVADLPAKILAYQKAASMLYLQDKAEVIGEEREQLSLQSIFAQLKSRTGHDFSNYKRATLLRRIERRISVHGLPNLTSYVQTLNEKPQEVKALLKDLLISVTNFFRDREAFKYLEKEVIPALFKGKRAEDQIRIWVAGCATGEEAYSIAILCAEHALRVFDAPSVQIFATDIDESAITIAREGLYTINDAADVSAERLKQFFVQEGDLHRVHKEIRQMILFANHNFIKDPPFSRLDLISCRNVLIYLNQSAQTRVMESFHFALVPKAFLFLGTSESVDSSINLYTVESREHHVYSARAISLRNYPVPDSVPNFEQKNVTTLQHKPQLSRQKQVLSFGDLHQKMLEEYAPPSVVINLAYDIVHMTEKAGKYFEFTGGEPSRNLLKLVAPTLRLELRAALFQAVQFKGPIEIQNIRTSVNEKPEVLDIQIRPALKEGEYAEGFILIIFKPVEDLRPDPEMIVVESNEPLAKHLEEEFNSLKAQLRDSIEHHEYQAEELKASNEELQAMNEELRSAAEELETSKEELQSINEELRTVNQELKVKVEETTISSNNLQNLINSASVATIFVDRNFAIKLYTPSVLEIFNLKSGDYGRPITDITHNLRYDGLVAMAETVLTKLSVVEEEVTTTDHRSYMMRMLPYRTSEERIGGVVITFFDISKRKASEQALRHSEEQNRMLIEGVKDYAIFMIDPQRRVVVWNSGAQFIFGYNDSEILGHTSDIFFTPEDQEADISLLEIEQSAASGSVENERWHLRKDGSRFWGSGITQPIRREDGEITGFVKILRDLTGQKELQEALKLAEDNYRAQLEKDVEQRTLDLKQSKDQYLTLVENTPDVITRWDRNLRLLFANVAFDRLTGVSSKLFLGNTIQEIDARIEAPIPFTKSLQLSFKTGKTVEDFSTLTISAQTKHFHCSLTPEKDREGETHTIVAIARDITEIKNAEIALNENRNLLKSILDNSSISLSVLKAVEDESGLIDFEITLTNRELEKETGRQDLVGKMYTVEYPGIKTSGLFDIMKRVFYSGKSEGTEYFYPHDGFDKWFSCMFVKMGDSLLATNLDISERKVAEEHVKNSEERLRMFVTASSDLIFLMDAQWSSMLVLKSENILAGATVSVDEWMNQYIPNNHQESMRKAINKAIAGKTLLALEHEILLPNGSVGWSSTRAIPLLNDQEEVMEWFGVATDITDTKLFEQERNRSYLLLQRSEEVAGTGTWEYNLLTEEISWSDGMYRLFGQEKGANIALTIYQQFAVSDDLAIAQSVVQRVQTGIAINEEKLRVSLAGTMKVLSVTAKVITNAEGVAVRMLGVDMDVTLNQLAEEKMKQMEIKSQLEVFKAILKTQEEERRRISESLHNGLGQLLYGIKLRMANVRREGMLDHTTTAGAELKYTEKLLTEAIVETRSISHKLVPADLEKFGLSSAINEVCKQLNGDVAFTCTYVGLDQRLDNYLELAVFRIVQELMLNVVKHSTATKATVSIKTDADVVEITVGDNGQGILDIAKNQGGIGLTSIQSKIKLLNGRLKIKTEKNEGTEVVVQIPRTSFEQ